MIEKWGDLLLTGHHEGSVVAGVHEGRVVHEGGVVHEGRVVDCHVGVVDVHEGQRSAWGRRDVREVQVGLALVRHGGDSCVVFHEGTSMGGRTCY